MPSPAFAAMCAPMTGTTVRSSRPPGPTRAKPVPLWLSESTSTVQSARENASSVAIPRVAIVTTGMSASTASRTPGVESSEMTARRARSDVNSGALAR